MWKKKKKIRKKKFKLEFKKWILRDSSFGERLFANIQFDFYHYGSQGKFGWFSLFKGISTFVSYLMTKSFLRKDCSGTI